MRHICQYDPTTLMREAAEKLEVDIDAIEWHSWPEVFPSSSGPHGGVGGQTMTTFQVYGFIDDADRALMWCAGRWRWWRDTRKQRFQR